VGKGWRPDNTVTRGEMLMEEGPRPDNPATLGAPTGRRRSRLRWRQDGERKAAARSWAKP
jgi:hypothetical protein